MLLQRTVLKSIERFGICNQPFTFVVFLLHKTKLLPDNSISICPSTYISSLKTNLAQTMQSTFYPIKMIAMTTVAGVFGTCITAFAQVGVGVKAPKGAEVYLDGSRKMLDEKWIYWEGPRFAAKPPIKWTVVNDPVDKGTVINCNDPASAGGLYGAADIVTKKEFKDFRAHVEFLITKPGGNSGVYLQNRYEIQVLDGDTTSHGMAAVINESKSPYYAYNGIGKWNSYDILFRAARFKDGKMVEQPMVTLYFNGKKVHSNQKISQVWGGPNSGIDGGNNGGKGITDKPGGLKLQSEGHDVYYRNIWIKEMELDKADTSF